MKHIITGCAGFVASSLIRRLLKDNKNEVYGVDSLVCGFMENMEDFIDNENFYFHKGDIRDKEVFDFVETDIDILWHFAARGEVYICAQQPSLAIDVNIAGTVNVIERGIEKNIKHMMFSDTSAEYDSLEDEAWFPSSEVYAPNISTPMGVYPITKMAAAQFVRSYGKKFGFGTTLFRYTNIYGPSMNLARDIPPVIGSFANKLLRGETPIIYGDGTKRRDFLHIDDLTLFHLAAIKNRMGEYDTQTYNAGSGENWSIKEIYDTVWDACQPIKPITQHDKIEYRPDQADEALITLADISKARAQLKWFPLTTLRNGVKSTVKEIYKDILKEFK